MTYTAEGQDPNLDQINVEVGPDEGVNSNDRNFAYLDQIQAADFEPLRPELFSVIQFQGVTFDMNKSMSTPIEVLKGQKIRNFDRFTRFLKIMESYSLLSPS